MRRLVSVNSVVFPGSLSIQTKLALQTTAHLRPARIHSRRRHTCPRAGRHLSPIHGPPAFLSRAGRRPSMAATFTVAARLPLRGPARAPSRPVVAAVTRLRSRQERRGLAATGGRGPARVRAETFSGGGGVGRRDPMAPPYNVLITGSTKGIVEQLGAAEFSFKPHYSSSLTGKAPHLCCVFVLRHNV